MRDFALQWFARARAGQHDRTQFSAAYSAQLTDDAMRRMSHCLNEYGAQPKEAEIVQSRSIGDQTFHLVKFLFPRGDATSLLFGFDAAGKITGIAVTGMAGD